MENALERRLLCSVSCEANSLSFSGNMSGWTFFIKLLEEPNFKASFSILAHILDWISTKDRAVCIFRSSVDLATFQISGLMKMDTSYL